MDLILSIIAIILGSFIFRYFTDKRFSKEVNRFFIYHFISIKNWVFRHFDFLLPLQKKKTVYNFGSIGCNFGHKASEGGKNGLKLETLPGDGKAEIRTVNKDLARKTNNEKGLHFIYISIDGEYAKVLQNKKIYIIIEYLDLRQNGFGRDKGKRGLTLQYDSQGKGSIENKFKSAGDIVFDNKKHWKLGVFTINDGYFQKRQQNHADFRLSCIAPNYKKDYDLIVSKILITPTFE